MKILLSVYLLMLFAAEVVFAGYDGVSYKIHQSYLSPRAMGMGGAFVAVANDYTAIYYNPAGLAFRENGEMNLSFGVGMTSSFQSFGSEISTASSTKGSETDKQNAIFSAIQKQYGKSFGGRFVAPNGVWVGQGWGVGFIPADISLELTPNQPVAVNATMYLDTTFSFAWADTFKDIESAKVSWGITGKVVNRGYFSKAIDAIELAADSSFVQTSDLKEGYFIDADVGFLVKPHIDDDGSIFSLLRLSRPTFGLVVRNIVDAEAMGSLKLFNKEATSASKPEKLTRVIDIGSRWEYPSLWIFGGRGTLDFRNILHPAFNIRKGTHIGFEFDWTMFNWWKGNYRFGLNQGYFTAGASALFAWFNLDLVTYGEDVGTFNSPKENRVYALQMNLNF
ncbi:MAG: hypothetical protein J0M15_02420 [Deltaproteobacteria bacterium]|jgi:hypothetical protein|nr:hypothetical protein [Deltaproteobacteria bacterium]